MDALGFRAQYGGAFVPFRQEKLEPLRVGIDLRQPGGGETRRFRGDPADQPGFDIAVTSPSLRPGRERARQLRQALRQATVRCFDG